MKHVCAGGRRPHLLARDELPHPDGRVQMQQFQRLADSATRVRGVKRLRRAFVPGTLADRTTAELRAFVEGTTRSPDSRSWKEWSPSSPAPLDEDDLKGLTFERETPRLLDPDTDENLRRLFEENRWTDFLPIVLPTEERVEAMLKGTSHSPDEVVGQLSPTQYREPWHSRSRRSR